MIKYDVLNAYHAKKYTAISETLKSLLIDIWNGIHNKKPSTLYKFNA